MVSISQQDDSKKVALDTSGPTNACDTSSIQRASIYMTNGQTKRGLSPRHVQLMAIAGSIGTALFVGIGGALSKAGPLSLSLGYLFWSMFFILPCTLSVAEMCAYLPIRGSIFELASRFVDPALGFSMGWTYFYGGVMLVCVEYSAVATVMQYWNTSINAGVWVAMALVVCFLLNVIAVKWYGESEFIMASTKVILIIGLILLTLITMCGGNPRGGAYGFRYWGGGNAMHAYYTDGAAGRFLGFWSVVIYAAFTIGGPDLICFTAGEIQNPRKTIPRVARLIFYRLAFFYVVGVFAVGILCSSRDERLLNALGGGASGAAASPWVIGIQNLGIHGLPDVINAVILLSGWRVLWERVPVLHVSLLVWACSGWTRSQAVTLLSCLSFLVVSNSSVTVFYWFVDLTTGGFVYVYTCMLLTFIGWHRALKAQPDTVPESSLPYLSPFRPYGAYFAFVLGCIFLLFIGWDTFSPFDVEGFITYYFATAFGPLMLVIGKLAKKTKWVKPAQADLITGKAEVDEECQVWEDPAAIENEKLRLQQMNWLRRFWEKLW
ncbi:general amino acid permease [Fusarium circinatum]|uniref:General amino acid permease n=1 Tax=Fusarium circinatum TaxID=48490 RepID=A0A8H5X6T9_FUSCI|nr:general amino acid permease [Fusarium circinatum]